MDKDKALIVKQLIEQLKLLPEDLPVMTEGCDCYGEANNCRIVTKDETFADDFDFVLIGRPRE